MKKPLYLTAILIFVIFTSIQAQSNAGFEALERGDFQTAQTIFEALYKSKKTKIVGAHGLSLLYFHANFSDRNLARAHTYSIEGVNIYRELNSKQKKKLRDIGWKYKDLRELKTNILTAAIADAKSQNTEVAFTELLENFKLKYTEKKVCYRSRNVLIVNAAHEGGTYADYAKIYEKYPSKEFTRYTPDIAAEIDLLLFDSFIAENGYENLAQFKKAHPKSSFANDGSLDQFIEADKKGTRAAFGGFLAKYPNNPLTPIAEKKYRYLKKKEILESLDTKTDEKAFAIMQDWLKNDIDSAFWDVVVREATDFEPRLKNYPFYQDFVDIIGHPSESIQPIYLEALNSPKGEYAVCLSTDMKTLYFCGKSRPDGLGMEDIFSSQLLDGQWSKPTAFKNINTTFGNEAIVSVTTDGTQILLFEEGYLSYSNKTMDGWTKPIKFKSPINEFGWQADAQIVAGLGMIFVGPDKTGHTDIYYAKRKGDNEWHKPINIGKIINTEGTERTPYLHLDNKTMYFSSNGHGGLGESDVFITSRLDDTWTNWSKPVNLGKDINTSGRDWGYKIASDGKRAFYASSNGISNDLYEIKLPERYRPGAVTVIKAQISTLNISDKKVIIEDAETGELLGIYKPDPSTGEVLATVPSNVKTTIRVEAKGVLSAPKIVDTNRPNNIIVDEVKLDDGELRFSDLLFDTDSDVINDLFYEDLNRVAAAPPSSYKHITVTGHTDNQGSEEYNLSLSQRRAEAVKTYLVQKGVPEYKITAIGYGESVPIKDNDTEEGRRLNRRVVLKFKENKP